MINRLVKKNNNVNYVTKGTLVFTQFVLCIIRIKFCVKHFQRSTIITLPVCVPPLSFARILVINDAG